jgi:hypothetical protein
LEERIGFLDLEAEAVQHLASAECGDGECPAVEVLRYPSPFQSEFEQGSS